jgi:hypothetical protein
VAEQCADESDGRQAVLAVCHSITTFFSHFVVAGNLIRWLSFFFFELTVG